MHSPFKFKMKMKVEWTFKLRKCKSGNQSASTVECKLKIKCHAKCMVKSIGGVNMKKFKVSSVVLYEGQMNIFSNDECVFESKIVKRDWSGIDNRIVNIYFLENEKDKAILVESYDFSKGAGEGESIIYIYNKKEVK